MAQNLNCEVNARPCHLVAMPYPGRGLINPMLNLCKLILTKSPNNFFITFVVTEEWFGILSSEPKPPANFRYAALPQVIPSEAEKTADMAGFVEAVATKLQDPFERLLGQLQQPAAAIIYDVFLSWVVGVGNQRNIPVASLVIDSASFFTLQSHFDLLVQNGHVSLDASEATCKLGRENEIVDYIPGISSMTLAELPKYFQVNGKKLLHQMLEMVSTTNNAQYMLMASIYELEHKAIETLKIKFPIPFYSIGPMIPFLNLANEPGFCEDKTHHYFQWLDSQPRGSVLYISFGSFLSISKEQIQEMKVGIEKSDVRFLWITRGNNTSTFKDGISDDGKGLLVPWCDQLRVLCHPSIGGFWTHCGWNSTLEGLYAGVPMLTCPISWDQFLTSKIIVNDLKTGLRVIKKDHLKAAELVKSEKISEIVRKFMDPESHERKEMVRRAEEVRDIFGKSVANGGSCASDLDAFLSNILSIYK